MASGRESHGLRVSGLTASPPGRDDPVVRNLTLDLPPGTRLAVMGPNGSGKSTLLLALAGLIPRTGECRIPGPVGLLLQDPDVGWATASVGEEIRFTLECRQDPDMDVGARVDRVLETFDLTDLRHRDPHTLSAGERQRLQLAAVMATDPATLLLDEPTAFLDPRASRDLGRRLRNLASPSVIVWVTHDPEIALASDRLLVLVAEGGTVEGPPSATFGDDESSRWGIALPEPLRVARALVPPRAGGAPPWPCRWDELARWGER